MATTSISIINDLNTKQSRVVFGPTLENYNAIGDILKSNYNTPDKINLLLDGGDIIALGATVESTSYSGNAAREYSDLDISETQLIPKEINFVFLGDKWTVRPQGEDGYSPL